MSRKQESLRRLFIVLICYFAVVGLLFGLTLWWLLT